MPDLRVLIVADDPLARAGLAVLLAGQPGLIVAGRMSGAEDVDAAMAAYRPDALLWDLGWSAGSSLGRALERQPDWSDLNAPVVALLPDDAGARAAWTLGARGLLRRDAEPAQLAAALAAAANGLSTIDPSYTGHLFAAPDNPPGEPGTQTAALVEPLSPRELAVLRLVAEGLANKTIAAQLEISEHTVKFHVNAILGKLGVASRTEAVVRATRLGLIFL